MDNNNNAVIENTPAEVGEVISRTPEDAVNGSVKWKDVWDKITTGILIFLICSPALILLYIFLWFIFKP